MKYLLKKADHDILNRDSAIVYAGGKFYSGGTHNICLKKIKDDNPKIKTILRSYQYRADIEEFMEISKHAGAIILAHLAKKEDGVFIDFGIIDGEYKEFDDIPDKYKQEFKNEFKMEVYDEMKHDMDIRRNPESNPYKDDKEEITKNVNKELSELKDRSGVEDYLRQQGYERQSTSWINKDNTIAVHLEDAYAGIAPIGEKEIECQLDEVPKILETVKLSTLDKFKKYNPKNLRNFFYVYDFFVIFENNNDIEVCIKMLHDNYTITAPSDLRFSLPYDFCYDTIDECMEYIIDWKLEKEDKNTTKEDYNNTNENNNDDDLDLDDIDFSEFFSDSDLDLDLDTL